MSIKTKVFICWIWANKDQILEDVLLYADTLDPLNLCFVLICEMLRFSYDEAKNKTHKKNMVLKS